MKKSPYTTDTITLSINAGASSGAALQAIEPGKVVGVCLVTNGGANTGMVRVKVTDSTGADVVKITPIQILRNREADWSGSFYPLNFESQTQQLKFEIIASANFTTALIADLVFIYDTSDQIC